MAYNNLSIIILTGTLLPDMKAKPSAIQATRGRRSSAAAAANRERIIDAALSCFARLGYKNTTNETIAREAGLTAGAIYNHFRNKSELYISAFEKAEMDLVQIHLEASAEGCSAQQAMETFFRCAGALYQSSPDAARFLSQVSVEIFHHTELAMPLAERVKGGVEALLKQIIENGKKQGEIHADIDPEPLIELHINAQLGIAQVSLFYGADYYRSAMENLKNSMLKLIFADQPQQQKNTRK